MVTVEVTGYTTFDTTLFLSNPNHFIIAYRPPALITTQWFDIITRRHCISADRDITTKEGHIFLRNIFIGLLWVFLDFNLDLGTIRIGLIPDFVGYIFIIKGLEEMASQSTFFSKTKPFATGMLVFTSILYALDLFGLALVYNPMMGLVLGLVSTAISLYITYNIVMGVSDMEKMQERNLNGFQLYNMWKVLAILNIVMYILLFIPALGLMAFIALLIVNIMFLVAFNKSKNLYEGRTY